MRTLATLVLGAVVAFVGCNKSEPGGSNTTSKKDSFTVGAPAMGTSIKQGESRMVQLTVDRGDDFKQDVTLTATPPEGIAVEFLPATVKASDKKEVEMKVTPSDKAALGDHEVVVTAKPKTGNETTIKVKVKVEKKGE